MPYMDSILADRAREEDERAILWQRHVHWGYWADPAAAGDTYQDYAAAAEDMTLRIIETAGVRDGMRVLDCGCGIGGTIATLNERYRDMTLVGLNIAAGQLAIARSQVTPRPGNKVEFIEADACAVPFVDGSFDVVLAIESIFHFKGRRRFLQEARRVLAPEGKVTLTDFVAQTAAMPVLVPLNWSFPFFGKRNPVGVNVGAYRVIGRAAGLQLVIDDDITRNTLPSYRALLRYFGSISPSAGMQGRLLARIHRAGLVRYRILVFAVASRQAERAAA